MPRNYRPPGWSARLRRCGDLVIWLVVAACSTGDVTDTKDTPYDAVPVDVDGDSDTDSDADSDTDTDVDTDPIDTASDTGGQEPCENVVVDRFPGDGDDDVYARTDVWFVLTDADPAATITVTDLGGNAVMGSTTVDDLLVVWVGDPLATETDYLATVTHACGSDVTHFTTSDVGAPLGVDPTGLVYSIDLGTGIWVEPLGLGSVLAAQLGDADLLLSPTSIDVSGVDLLGALGAYDIQDLCLPTIPLPSAVWADPYFELTSPLIWLDFGGVTVDVADVELSGSFASDGSRIQFGELKGLIDTRPLGAVLGLGVNDDAVCMLIASFGLGCEACADGQPYCMSVWVDDLEAPIVPGTLVPRTTGQILADPTCP